MLNQDELATIAGVANKATYAGTASALYGGYTANELAAFGGIAIALLGFLVQLWFKIRADRRQVELHKEQLANLRRFE